MSKFVVVYTLIFQIFEWKTDFNCSRNVIANNVRRMKSNVENVLLTKMNTKRASLLFFFKSFSHATFASRVLISPENKTEDGFLCFLHSFPDINGVYSNEFGNRERDIDCSVGLNFICEENDSKFPSIYYDSIIVKKDHINYIINLHPGL